MDGRRSERTLEVLGLTLNTTWPQLVPWLTGHDAPAHWRMSALARRDTGVVGVAGPRQWTRFLEMVKSA